MRCFGMIWLEISDPRSLESCASREAMKTWQKKKWIDRSVPLMQHDPSNLGSIIFIDPDYAKGTYPD